MPINPNEATIYNHMAEMIHDESLYKNMIRELTEIEGLTQDQIGYLIYRTKRIQENSVYGMSYLLEKDRMNKNHTIYGDNSSIEIIDKSLIPKSEFSITGGKNAMIERRFDFVSGKFVSNPFNVVMAQRKNFIINYQYRKCLEKADQIIRDPLYWIHHPFEHILMKLSMRSMQLNGDFNEYDKIIIDYLVMHGITVALSYNDGDVLSTISASKSLFGSQFNNIEKEVRVKVIKMHQMYIRLFRLKII